MSSSSSPERRPDEPIPLAPLPPWPLSLPRRVPAPLTPLIGREAELARIAALMRDPAVRLVTLIGPGGVGKTRLALQVAAEIADEFADGVAFVGLAPVRDPSLVAPEIVQALGILNIGSRPVVEVLRTMLRDQALLLLLDNFEQVVAAGEVVADLLASCLHLKALVTSRALLHLPGERAFPVPPLTLPDLGTSSAFERVATAEAIRLFVAAARVRSAALARSATAASPATRPGFGGLAERRLPPPTPQPAAIRGQRGGGVTFLPGVWRLRPRPPSTPAAPRLSGRRRPVWRSPR